MADADVAAVPAAEARRGTGGRPTREEAARRDERLIEVATRLFMERGFDATSIDAVAEAAGVSKPTVYARYRDKRELFTAVLQRRINGWLAPLSAVAEAHAAGNGDADIRATLHELSRTLLCHANEPGKAALHRILVAQAVQFPELARMAHEEGWLRGVRAIATLLRAAEQRGEIQVDDPDVAANSFLSLVLGHSQRVSMYGIAVDLELRERHRHGAVELFLRGVQARP